jgi:hypothetical protein
MGCLLELGFRAVGQAAGGYFLSYLSAPFDTVKINGDADGRSLSMIGISRERQWYAHRDAH